MTENKTLYWRCDCGNGIAEGDERMGQDGALRCRCGRPLSGDPEPRPMTENRELEPLVGLHATLKWEPYVYVGDGYKADAFRRSDGMGYIIPYFDELEWKIVEGRWWATWAHPLMCGRPGWHHHALGTYPSANAGAMAFDMVYELERLTGNVDRCPDAIRASVEPRLQQMREALADLLILTKQLAYSKIVIASDRPIKCAEALLATDVGGDAQHG